MKIAFATVDLLRGREKLMPWRTIIEVAKYANMQGHKATVLTMPVSSENSDYEFEGVTIQTVPREFRVFCDVINEKEYDVIYYPMPWREGLKDLSAFSQLCCKKIAYFPGGSVHWDNICALSKLAGWKTARPFLIDWLTPYRLLMSKLKKAGFHAVIAQSPYTAATCSNSGFDNVRMIVPGKDDFEKLEEDKTVLERLQIAGKRYLLFTGAPAPIRGASLLLKAIDRMAGRENEVFCLFLMRKDVGADFSVFERTYQQMKSKEKVRIEYTRLNRNELKTVMAHARAVVLPFLLVPSEIPITFYEVLSLGTPVVTFENGGTTDYLTKGVLSSKTGEINRLVENLLKIWGDNNLYDDLCLQARSFMAKHPTWDIVARQWLDSIEL